MMLHRRREPSIEQLSTSPELASLAVLEMAADTAVLALVAAHPELRDRDRDPADDSNTVLAAHRVIELLRGVCGELGRYRLELRRARKLEDE